MGVLGAGSRVGRNPDRVRYSDAIAAYQAALERLRDAKKSGFSVKPCDYAVMAAVFEILVKWSKVVDRRVYVDTVVDLTGLTRSPVAHSLTRLNKLGVIVWRGGGGDVRGLKRSGLLSTLTASELDEHETKLRAPVSTQPSAVACPDEHGQRAQVSTTLCAQVSTSPIRVLSYGELDREELPDKGSSSGLVAIGNREQESAVGHEPSAGQEADRPQVLPLPQPSTTALAYPTTTLTRGEEPNWEEVAREIRERTQRSREAQAFRQQAERVWERENGPKW